MLPEAATTPLEREARLAGPLLEEVFGGAVRRLRALLATRTGTDTPVRFEGVRALELRELLDSPDFQEVALWSPFTTEGEDTPVFVLAEWGLLSWMMGLLFGERDPQAQARTRAVTQVERNVGARLCRELMEAVEVSWTAGPIPRFVAGAAAPSRRVAGDLDVGTTLLVVVLELGRPEEPNGRLYVALPTTLLRGMLPKGSVPAARSAERAPRFERVMPVELDLVVELARLSLPLKMLQALRPGDEVPLGAVAEVTARLGGRPAFVGEPGTSGTVRSLKITRKLNPGSSPERGDR